MPKQPYQRDKDGARLEFLGMNTVLPPDKVPPGKFPFAANVRRYLHGAVTSRATQDTPVETLPTSVHSIRRLNDSTPAGPGAGFVLIAGAADKLYAGTTQVDSGLSGNPISIIPFRPSASVQPWAYVGDSLKMDKVRSDGTRYAMGIAEPQTAPTIVAIPSGSSLSLLGAVTVSYWFDSPQSGPVGSYIWKNASDTGGAGPIRASTPPNGTTTGNSLLFDLAGNRDPSVPMAWVFWIVNNGTVNTSGTAVSWQSGDDFGDLVAGGKITINAVVYTIATVPSNTSLTLTTNAGTQFGVNYSAVTLGGGNPLFTPAPAGRGYEHFNFALTAVLYVPTAGTYTLTSSFKDDIIWGIGNTATGTVSYSPSGPGQPGQGNTGITNYGQTKTALNGYPLMQRTAESSGEDGFLGGAIIQATFSAPGNYPLEVDFDYWYHDGRTLAIRCNGADIQPIPNTVIVQAQYRYVYRSSATGATSNPSPASSAQFISVLANTITATPSTDPQVDKIDFYRLDTGLLNYTYVGTGPNSSAPFSDTVLDAAAVANPILQFDNYQPFPSIDLPRKGVVNVANGIATWVSGDQFNIRWLPGTIIVVGGVAYTFDKRPTSTTQLTAVNVEIVGGIAVIVQMASGTGLIYEIAEPDLAAQPLPYIWGPTDNVNFAFGCGDPMNPGTLYWCKGNNLDSAPQTNQANLTSPSEPLQNGCIVNGLGMVFSPERAWLIVPNFFNALATVQGTVGATWTFQGSILTRGLYMPRALATDGSGNVFFRAKDGICISPGGQGEKSITDEDLYNLFPHEGMVPQPVVRGGYTVYPPDDTRPQAQKLNCANGYLYYDYQDATGTLRTLVFDIAAKGWVWDAYQYPVSVHVLEEGAGVNGTLTGCLDGSVRPLTNTGAESSCSVVLTPCHNAGETRSEKHYGDLYVEANTVGS